MDNQQMDKSVEALNNALGIVRRIQIISMYFGALNLLILLFIALRIVLGDTKDFGSIIVYALLSIIFLVFASDYCCFGTNIIKRAVQSLTTSASIHSVVLLAESMRYPRVRPIAVDKLTEILADDVVVNQKQV